MAWELATFSSDLMPSEFDVEGADVQVVRPGEPVRVTHVLDAVEPRIRPDGRAAFPAEGKAGEGRTNRLDGVVILSCLDFAAEERPLHEQEAIVDLAGPGAEFTPFARFSGVERQDDTGLAGNEHAEGAARKTTLRV